MPDIRILLGNEPRAYREVLASAFLALRPDLDLLTVESSDLDREIARLAPQLVICTHLSESTRAIVPDWIVLYPDGASLAIASIGGEQTTSNDFSFDTLLTLIDRVEQIVNPPTPRPVHPK